MLKLVGSDVPSIEEFMKRYRVCMDRLRAPRPEGLRRTGCRWTIPPLYTGYKWAFQQL